MKDSDKNDLPVWLQWLSGGIGLVGVMVLVGGSAIAFVSFSWPFILLILVWGGGQWAWELWQDHRAWKKEGPWDSSRGPWLKEDITDPADDSDKM